ncbi:hypothetical protein B0H10DRAFT_2041070 [Mycena sp. CBHHK59/15]|nr:hypothetical protein B0H10DRAFT_2041070 [Mycena sp. CBHHK59/15]
MPTEVQQPPTELHHDPHNKHAHALHRDALMQALGSILAPKRPIIMSRSSSASTVDSSRSSSGTASPAHPHVLPHLLHSHSPTPPPPPHSTPVPAQQLHPPHTPSPLASPQEHEQDTAPQDHEEDSHHADSAPASPTSDAQAPMPVSAAHAHARAKFIDSLKSKNGAWDALIHGSFS